MRLGDFLREKRLTNEEFGELVGASPGAVRKWRGGERMPRAEALARIKAVTDGIVTADDFLPQQEPAE